jgi:subtilisin family serine protease
VIDIEGGWTLDHVDFRGNSSGLIGGQPFTDAGWTNHGTAVLGEIRAGDNGFGITGIAPECTFSVVSHQGLGSSGAIDLAASSLATGDIMLLEMHRPGPRFGFSARDDQQGYIAVEWWPDDFLAIRRAVLRGIIVVEAAGNGAQNLDDPFYDQPDPSFPDSWKNPFRGAANSGAIVVGAGAPPSGQFGPDRSRLDFSNYGSRIDCQGWGRGVVTTGYGDLYGGSDDAFRTVAYTAEFSGTSSASPIVTGVVACLQGIARAQGSPLDPTQVKNLLRQTGSPQMGGFVGGISQRIGNRPDLTTLIASITGAV